MMNVDEGDGIGDEPTKRLEEMMEQRTHSC
jgi:hypothetical protein